jgi:D-glycero-alpha-D-manno-heptose-7-phosphate kinase
MDTGLSPLRIINSRASVRICDNGGWTDTWFARYGCVTHIAVSPRVEVQVLEYASIAQTAQCRILAENYTDDYIYSLQGRGEYRWGKHPLLEAAIESMHPPAGTNLAIYIHSRAPGGASIGTSASVSVALLGALNMVLESGLSRMQVARKAHQVETDFLKQQSGIQDQIAAAHGGINFIDMHEFPDSTVEQLVLPADLLCELERRLVLVYIGKPHRSSEVHEMVIRHLQDAGPDCPELEDLRQAARVARDALLAGNLQAFGASLVENNQAQKRLHPALVSRDAEKIIRIARQHGAVGWKVNGAGGEGGSVSILCGCRASRINPMLDAITDLNPAFRIIPLSLDHSGLQVWEAEISRV